MVIALNLNIKRMAQILSLCLICMVSTSFAVVAEQSSTTTVTGACTPLVQKPVAPGDQIDLRGPDVTADQKELGVTWTYQWTVKENDASGSTVAQYDTQSISFIVPDTKYANSYYFDLMVTAGKTATQTDAKQPMLCVNEACMKFPIVPAGECKIETKAPDSVCISDKESYTYITAPTPSQVNQRWWIFPLDKLPKDVSQISYEGHTVYKAGDGNSISVNWNDVAKESGVYVVFSGYYATKPPYKYQGSCQMRVTVVGVPLNTITVK